MDSDRVLSEIEEKGSINANSSGRKKKRKKKKKVKASKSDDKVASDCLPSDKSFHGKDEDFDNVLTNPSKNSPNEKQCALLEEKERILSIEDRNGKDSDKELVGSSASSETGNVDKSLKENPASLKAAKKKKKKKKVTGYYLSDLNLDVQDPEEEKKESKASCNIPPSDEADKSDFKRLRRSTSLLLPEKRERNNHSKILIIINGLGLDTLRKVFMDIHPEWSNNPDDAKNLDKGVMKLQGHESVNFYKGNINKWDVSLITTVLLYSKKCSNYIRSKIGYEAAIRSIKDQKNILISHVLSDRMEDSEFNKAWATISKNLETLGAKTEDIDDIFTDDNLENAKFYRDLHLKELSLRDAEQSNVLQKIDKVSEEVEKISRQLEGKKDRKEDLPRFEDLSGPKWDEYIRFCENVQDFDHEKNNYILVTDQFSEGDLGHFSLLRSVPWKLVLDFDPKSEEHGMYNSFMQCEGKNSLIDMITPDEIRRNHSSTISLARSVDSRKTQWLFINGREKDNGVNGCAQDLQHWKTKSLKHVSRFLSCCSDPDVIDKHKQLICLILPFRKLTLPFLKKTMKRLFENFSEFPLRFVGVGHENFHDFHDYQIRLTNLPPPLLGIGLKHLLNVSTDKQYPMPTFQAQLPVHLTSRQYLFLQEYLHVLYIGCEDLPKVDNDDDKEKLKMILNDHKEAFLSGNWISFLSLYDNHDARRELGNEVQNYIHRHLGQDPTHSTILEIRHSPGTGGTTIARRVLWDLHKTYPCAVARLENYKFDFDDDLHFIHELADRIKTLQDICEMIPVVLLDGNHSRIEALSHKLVRVLNTRGQRAVLLSCLHPPAKAVDDEKNAEAPEVHKRFYVNVKLEDCPADLHQFEEKYKNYIEDFKRKDSLSPSRVFHFPLLAMLKGLEGFNSKLHQIIFDSFDEMDGLRKNIAVVVAFIQMYASQETPGSFLNKVISYLLRQGADAKDGKVMTYQDINQLITEHLLSLMVPAKPSNKTHRRAATSNVTQSYTFQHPLVAELVLKRYYDTHKCDILSLTRDFLEYPIFQDSDFFSLVNSIFIRNRSSVPKARFSILFEELSSINPRSAGKIFHEFAEKTGDAISFAHAAQFHAKNSPRDFKKAKHLISEAFKCKNASKRERIIYDKRGQILQIELKALVEKDKIDRISDLDALANEALKSYHRSRNWPLSYPWPLMGEVKVWISCIEWIVKNKCDGDTDRAFKYLTSEAPPFFHTCVGDSLYLLDLVVDIAQKHTNLADPEEVQRQSNDLRMSLLTTFKSGLPKKRSGRSRMECEQDIIKSCKAICSSSEFCKSSAVELKRLKVYYILNNIDLNAESIDYEVISYLLKLLDDLVFTDKQNARVDMARHLMKVCLHATGTKHYSLEKGLRIAEVWIQESGYNPMPHFYKMMIAFLMILDGNQVFYRSIFTKAQEKCKEKSQNHCRRLVSTHFLKKTGEGMNRLMTKGALLAGEEEYPQNLVDFWTTHSRRKLKECTGRIRVRPGSKSGKRKQVYIELVQGNIEIYVSKNADIGIIERDFTPGTMVYFVVSFNLDGPVANGITFNPRDSNGH